MTNMPGRVYSKGVETGKIIIAPSQYDSMNPSMQQDFVAVRTAKGTKMYVRNTEAAIKLATEIHKIITEINWLEEQDPEYQQFITDVSYVTKVLLENYFTPEYDDELGQEGEGEDFSFVTIMADSDEDPDYLCAVAYTAFAEMKIKAHPAVEHQFDNFWMLYIVD